LTPRRPLNMTFLGLQYSAVSVAAFFRKLKS